MSKKALGNFVLLVTAMIWGIAFVFQSEGMDHIGPFTFGMTRIFLAALALGLLSFILDVREGKLKPEYKEKADPEFKKNTIKGGLCCSVFFILACSLQQVGICYTTVGKAGFFTALYILLVPIFGALIFKKRIGLPVWIAVVIGMAGMYFLSMDGEGITLNNGDILIIGCGFCYAGHVLCVDHFVPKANITKLAFIQFAVGCTVSAILAFIFEEPTWAGIKEATWPIVFCGLLSGGAGYTLQMFGQKLTDPTSASLLMSLESVFAALSGFLILREILSGREVLGCVIMFVAILIVQIPFPERSKNGR